MALEAKKKEMEGDNSIDPVHAHIYKKIFPISVWEETIAQLPLETHVNCANEAEITANACFSHIGNYRKTIN